MRPALALSNGDCLACIGGGGKTSTLSALAHDLASAGARVILTTTTRIRVPAETPLVLLKNDSAELDAVRRALDSSLTVAVGTGVTDTGKLVGLDVDQLCALRDLGVVLVEADGSAGRSLKAHASYEPVIPPCATHVLVVAGVDAVGQKVGEDTVHRLPDFERRFDVRQGAEITPSLVAAVLAALADAAPPTSRVIYVLNKVDSEERLAAAKAVADEMQRHAEDAQILFTVHGEALGQSTPSSAH